MDNQIFYNNHEESAYFEIADISTPENTYLHVDLNENTFRRNYDGVIYFEENYTVENYIPLSTFYYEALQLSLDQLKIEREYRTKFKNAINDFKVEVQTLWLYCSFNIGDNSNFETIKKSVKRFSSVVKTMVRDARLGEYNDNIDIRGFFESINIQDYHIWKQKNSDSMRKFETIRCVAIAYPIEEKHRDATNSYFSLNGASNDYIGNIQLLKNANWGYKIYTSYVAVGNLLEFLFGYRFIDSHLTDCTMRYTKFDSDIKPNPRSWNGEMESSPICLFNDLTYLNHPNFERHYSCCERKIIATMGYVNSDFINLLFGMTVINKLSGYIFKIMKEPCEMCRGALIGCYHIQIENRYSNKNRNHKISINPAGNPNEPLIVEKV